MVSLYVFPSRLSANIIESQIVPLLEKSDLVHSPRVLESNKTLKYTSLFELIIKRKLSSIDKIYIRDGFDFCFWFCVRKMFWFKYKIFYDFRALVFLEMEYKNKPNWKVFIIKKIERFAYRKADHLGAVSKNLRSNLIEAFGLNRDIIVFPCCFGHITLRKRPLTRRLLYVGGLSKWQNFDKVIESYIQLKLLDSNYQLTILSNNVREAERIVHSYGITEVAIKSVKHDEIFEEIQKHDFGFVLRDDNVVNQVASPIKVAEYICSGLVPIITNSVGDFSKLLKSDDLSVEYNDDIEMVHDQISKKISRNRDEIANKLYCLALNYYWPNVRNNHGFKI